MPDRDGRTLRDLMWYQYAKIIAKRALGPDAKREHYGFVKQTLRDLQSGKKQWSDIIPPLAEKKYLKTVYECLERCISFFSNVPQGVKQPDVLKLDETLKNVGHL